MISSEINAITDTPAAVFVREFIDLVPNDEVLHSVQDPFDWVLAMVMVLSMGMATCSAARAVTGAVIRFMCWSVCGVTRKC